MMSNTPSDAEIDEVTLDVLGYAALDKETNETARMIARAVLAKWGTPQPSPAPLSDDIVKDAARYRLLRRGRHWSVIDGIGNDLLRAEALDAAVDAALAAQGGNV